jgi:thiamine-monophosphate kinase
MDEFELIKKYFHNEKNKSFANQRNIVLGIGDDAAVFEIESIRQLVSSVDTFVEKVHFPADVSASDIAYKVLAVNLSDLAAMGAEPHSFTLSLTLPAINEKWLSDFSQGLFALANQHQLVLLGGDTSKGPLSITIQINGTVKKNQFLTRSAAQAGDKLFVTGYLGLAALGLQQWQQRQQGLKKTRAAQARFLQPEARFLFAEQLYQQGVRCCIDISDGLLAELEHLSKASTLSVRLHADTLLIHDELTHLEQQQRMNLMLAGGDDYELCFAVAPQDEEKVRQLAQAQDLPISCVGEFFSEPQAKVHIDSKLQVTIDKSGYKHF